MWGQLLKKANQNAESRSPPHFARHRQSITQSCDQQLRVLWTLAAEFGLEKTGAPVERVLCDGM
jgi:hypothetical protein